jgi:two-component system response regulator PilR (NtrC family)
VESRRVDVRILAATNEDLRSLVESGRFREDLYYRLNVIRVDLPPLRERLPDIPLLVDHFLRRYSEENDKSVTRVSSEVMERFMTHPWPGNVRELENVLERGVVLARDGELGVDLLPAELLRGASFTDTIALPPGLRFYDAVARYERGLIESALRQAGGVQKQAAEILGLKPTTLNEKIKRLGIAR